MPGKDIPQGRQAYMKILGEIRDGHLLPGQRLREVELAERMGQSRTPVREAIRLLETDGLVSHLPRVGAVIRSLNYVEVMELYEMRVVLEGTAARLAARAATEAELAQLESLNASFLTATGQLQAAEFNRRFHAMLLEAARNRYLVRAMLALEKSMLILGPTTLLEPQRRNLAGAEHLEIVTALRQRDGLAAEAAMRLHMEQAQMVRLRFLSQMERPSERAEFSNRT